jgi:hypothetical protein
MIYEEVYDTRFFKEPVACPCGAVSSLIILLSVAVTAEEVFLHVELVSSVA